jgi:dTDP-4-dehydrorhamnose 3,5-epimerase-like enzyme
VVESYYTPSPIDVHGSEASGVLVALESGRSPLPFDIKRIFYILGVAEGDKRGGHAHIKGDQFFICLAGKVEIMHEISPHKPYYVNVLTPPRVVTRLQSGVFVPAGRWVEITFTAPDTVLLCLCSNYYDEADYIRNRDEWIREFSKSGS